ncbi:MAG: hypothetical protein NTU84_00015 [Verrucomicrobia bacterium]|nr:hypothetical protein [Verrucomicrobiota bacterium]
MSIALYPRSCGRVFSESTTLKSLEAHEKSDKKRVYSNTAHKTGRKTRSKAAFKPLRLEPVARPGKGAHLTDCLAAMKAALDHAESEGFICFTITWVRLLHNAKDREIAQEQASLIHRLRRVLSRRGHHNSMIFSVLERTAKHGLHGHVIAQASNVDEHEELLDVVEESLIGRYGPLPPHTFNRDGRRWKDQDEPLGSIWTADQALGALRYRLKSLPIEPIEHGVRRGKDLRPVKSISIKISRGRNHAP